jgi:hypothetical protein
VNRLGLLLVRALALWQPGTVSILGALRPGAHREAFGGTLSSVVNRFIGRRVDRLIFYRMLLVSNENCVGKAMLALSPKGSKS